jgi:hypothetical protein
MVDKRKKRVADKREMRVAKVDKRDIPLINSPDDPVTVNDERFQEELFRLASVVSDELRGRTSAELQVLMRDLIINTDVVYAMWGEGGKLRAFLVKGVPEGDVSVAAFWVQDERDARIIREEYVLPRN